MPEDKTRSIVEYFMKSTLEIRRTNIEFYYLHSVYGNSIRNSLHYLRSNDQYWQYDPEADFPAFSETYKQDHFAKTLDTISTAEQAFNEHLLTNENTVDNSQTEF